MEALLETCSDCDGTRRGIDPYKNPSDMASSGTRGQQVVLQQCPTCNGTGKVLTAAGRAVAEVIRHVAAGGN